MVSNQRKLQLLATWGALLLLATAIGCKGFFVNPTLTTLTVGPTTPSVVQGSTLQMAATGTYDDGTTNSLTNNVLWSSDDTTVANIDSASGKLTAEGAGTATITAQSGTVSGSTTVTVTLANVIKITINPSSTSTTPNTDVQYTVAATVSGSSATQDVTSSVTWTASDPNVTFTNGQDPEEAQVGAVTVGTVVTITATYVTSSGTLTATSTLTVN
ncbi:MAG TPA: Ig-like domain-containing protein [Terriglobales bacterium]|nr:Ig-like domain-containing protein [Terriglobales bacterium]